ncbi:hypothetical protein H8A95_09050 [Bradyrhizobium sp. Pear76]|uniref:hypothetical protein n=1 Tax=Bradyrhizobium oropedii TaxID=1571201 RepID=UPI001E3CF0EB|nr:hypothetical protein [Bradyrhizobium oropedii]MCC8962458.1 hypothetical protein [Bradyrhizobium oropedii]
MASLATTYAFHWLKWAMAQTVAHIVREMTYSRDQYLWLAAAPPDEAVIHVLNAVPKGWAASRSERAAHHGIEKRIASHARRHIKRKNGGFWRAQLCTEVARHSEQNHELVCR